MNFFRSILLLVIFPCCATAAGTDFAWVSPLKPDSPAIISYGRDVPVPKGFSQPPMTRQIIRWTLEQLDAPASNDTRMDLSGHTAQGETIREFLLTPLELHTGIKGRNWISAKCEPLTSPTKKRYWRCGLIFWRGYDTQKWGFGVSFLVTEPDKKIVPVTMRTSSFDGLTFDGNPQ